MLGPADLAGPAMGDRERNKKRLLELLQAAGTGNAHCADCGAAGKGAAARAARDLEPNPGPPDPSPPRRLGATVRPRWIPARPCGIFGAKPRPPGPRISDPGPRRPSPHPPHAGPGH